MERLKIGVMGSGKGSNFRAILAAISAGELDVEPVLVASDFPDSGILALAREAGVAIHFVDEQKFRTKLSPATETALVDQLCARQVDLVVLAGYMRMVGSAMLEAFPRRIINIHPSLLPAFPGLEAWRQAIEAGVEKTGCTVHFVDAGMDTGEIIAQSEVPVLPGDSAESLHARIQVAEHELYPAVVGRFARRELA
jgi:phosphoribosylglycinamide formyltransferase-1